MYVRPSTPSLPISLFLSLVGAPKQQHLPFPQITHIHSPLGAPPNSPLQIEAELRGARDEAAHYEEMLERAIMKAEHDGVVEGDWEMEG